VAANSITLQEAAKRLGVHYMTAYRYVRTGRLRARRVGAQWQVDPADLAAVAATGGNPGRATAQGRRPSRAELRRRMADRLVAGDEPGSWAVAEAALAAGATPEEVVVDGLAAAMRTIGDRWAGGQLTVDDEHRASGVASRLVGRLGPLATRRGPKLGTVVLGCPAGERHGLPTALAANVLRGRGYQVVDLGADVPVDAFAAAVAKAGRPVAAAVGVTAGNHDRAVRAIVRAIRVAAPEVVVLVGGAGIKGAAHAARLGVGWSGPDATTLAGAVDEARRERH
jgi:MerR family transcriptional regulator, light-induced transcriptional regulator